MASVLPQPGTPSGLASLGFSAVFETADYTPRDVLSLALLLPISPPTPWLTMPSHLLSLGSSLLQALVWV